MSAPIPGVIGEPYFDGSGREYPALLSLRVLVFCGDAEGLRRAFLRGLGRDVSVSVYTDDMFSTMNDDDNRAVVAAVATDDLTVRRRPAVIVGWKEAHPTRLGVRDLALPQSINSGGTDERCSYHGV